MRTSGSMRPGGWTDRRRGTIRPSSSTHRLTCAAIRTRFHAERDRHVTGKYERSVDRNDTFNVGEQYEERFEGGVELSREHRVPGDRRRCVRGGRRGSVFAALWLGPTTSAGAHGRRPTRRGSRLRGSWCARSSPTATSPGRVSSGPRASSTISPPGIENFSAGAETYGTAIHIGAPGSGVTLET